MQQWPTAMTRFTASVLLFAIIIYQFSSEPCLAKSLAEPENNDENDAKIAVKELKDLRTGQTVEDRTEEKIKSENGVETKIKEQHKTVKDSNGKVLAEITKTETHSIAPVKTKMEAGNDVNKADKKSFTQNTHFKQPQNVEFNPLELARYIDETGDEEGIVMAINELLEDGLLTRKQALEYLQSIKIALRMMRTSEEHRGNELNGLRRPDKAPLSMGPPEESEMESMEEVSKSDYMPTKEEQEVLNKLQVADYLYKQYELQVIYQLFKDTFDRKLSTGNARDVRMAAERFSTFLENEKLYGKISEELQAEITETMMSAMVASLAERKRQHNFGNKFPSISSEEQMNDIMMKKKSFEPEKVDKVQSSASDEVKQETAKEKIDEVAKVDAM